MSITTAKYVGNGRVEAVHNESAVKVTTDARKPVGGLGENQTPVELLGNSLAACALTIMGLQAGKAGADFAGCYAEVGECEEDMEKFSVTRIPITFHLKAEFDEKLRKKLENFAHKGCFVGNSLTAEKAFTFVYE
ncbi:OsmC family protein [Prevotella dentasini]|uniref:OsmC family protein n=1 Tax=Prevotella dentasini TaxID=589537 RepID=UPI00046919FB|nr:OsmC family protein [Prevotella dentasini]